MRPWLRFGLTIACFALVVLASSLVGVPHDAQGKEDLPGVALDWRLLFHVLRASALVGALAAVLVIAWRGAHGDWPIKFGQVEYAPKEAISITADALEKQGRRLTLLEDYLGLDGIRIEDRPE